MKTLKVLLIQPSDRDCVRSLFGIYNTDEGIGFKPPLNLLYIATAIKEMTKHHVEILDCQLNDIHQGNIIEKINHPYDVVGISAWTDFWYQAITMAKKLKEKYPNTHIVMGGPHVNIFPKEVLEFDPVDSIIVGDGEIPMVGLLNKLSSNVKNNDQIPGVYFQGIKYKDYVPYICEDLDKLPIPDRKLLPFEKYTSVLSHEKYITSMITSRGCPYSCVFCKLKFQKPVRRSAENVIKEFEIIHRLGIREIEIYDDTFNLDHQRTIDICKGILDNKIEMKWSIRDRVDRVREDVLAYLKKAGCCRIHLGIESGSNKIIKNIKKHVSIEQARNAVSLAQKYNFIILTYFMYGLPGETLSDAEQTLNFALELDTDYAEFAITIPYPGTELYETALKSGVIPSHYWIEFTKNPTPSFRIPYLIENFISREEIMKIRDLSIRKFYFNPRYMIREFLKARSLDELYRKAKMGVGLYNIIRKRFKR